MCAVVPRYLMHMRSPLPADEMIFSSNQSDVDCRWVPLPPPADGLLQEGCPGIIGWCCLSQGVILLASCVFFFFCDGSRARGNPGDAMAGP